MDLNTLLYELSNEEWLMDLKRLYQIREAVLNGNLKSHTAKDADKKPQILEFFTEDYKRIDPRNPQEIPEGSIAVINVVGPMMKYWNWAFEGADWVIKQLEFCNNLNNVKAIILNVDGPGGAVPAISPFIEFKLKKKKPIVALCDAALSLHYWIPVAVADHIMARNTISARFGSVGVVTSWLDISKYYENLGVIEHEVYAEESKHKNEVHRKMKDNEEAAKKMLRERHLSPLAKKFQASVENALPNLKKEEGVLSGRTFGAEEALSLNMIHSIGSMEDAMQKAQMLAEVSNY